MNIWNEPLGDFLEHVASSTPTPGGGSVSTVAAAFGIGLVLMALEITQASDSSAERLQEVIQLRSLLEIMKELANKDVRVFDNLMTAYRLPKISFEEQKNRKTAIAEALTEATKVPLQVADTILLALDSARKSIKLIKKNVLSDVYVGADLLMGSLNGVLRNVDINLPAIENTGERETAKSARVSLHSRASEIYSLISMT